MCFDWYFGDDWKPEKQEGVEDEWEEAREREKRKKKIDR